MTAKEKLTALADAVREKSGETGVLTLDRMTALVKALESGGGLPSGWAMGEFVTTAETTNGDFTIEHGLGAVPNVVVVFCKVNATRKSHICGFIRFNYNEYFEETENAYIPEISQGRMLYFTSTGTTIAQLGDTYTGMDTEKLFNIPPYSAQTYTQSYPYQWIAIRL